jgi:hypothetical protein
MEDNSAGLNGYKPRSWGDVVAIASLLAMFMSVVAWGLKLEGELNSVRDDVTIISRQVGNGILPRSEERIIRLQADLQKLTDEINEHRRRVDHE